MSASGVAVAAEHLTKRYGALGPLDLVRERGRIRQGDAQHPGVGLEPGTRGVGPGDSVSQVRMDSWSAGRVMLVGDAGYCPSPLSGQGSSLALVGAYVLASELRAADGDHRDAFARYQRRIQDFVERNQQIATGNAKRFTPASRRQIWLQNQGIRALPYMPGKNWVLSLATKGVKEAANAITLPDPAP